MYFQSTRVFPYWKITKSTRQNGSSPLSMSAKVQTPPSFTNVPRIKFLNSVLFSAISKDKLVQYLSLLTQFPFHFFYLSSLSQSTLKIFYDRIILFREKLEIFTKIKVHTLINRKRGQINPRTREKDLE